MTKIISGPQYRVWDKVLWDGLPYEVTSVSQWEVDDPSQWDEKIERTKLEIYREITDYTIDVWQEEVTLVERGRAWPKTGVPEIKVRRGLGK